MKNIVSTGCDLEKVDKTSQGGFVSHYYLVFCSENTPYCTR